MTKITATPTASSELREHGGALVFALIAIASMLMVAAFGMFVGMGGRRASTQGYMDRAATLCADTALEHGRAIISVNTVDWNTVLAGGSAAWYPITGTCTGTAGYTYSVTMRDNVDEQLPTLNNSAVDNDLTVILDSEAIKGATVMAKVTGIVTATGAVPGDYKYQAQQGARKTGNPR